MEGCPVKNIRDKKVGEILLIKSKANQTGGLFGAAARVNDQFNL